MRITIPWVREILRVTTSDYLFEDEKGGPVANLIKTLPQTLERFTGITEGYEE